MPMKISITSIGNWNDTSKLLERSSRLSVEPHVLRHYAELGLKELEKATPKDTGKTANSWYYKLNQNEKGRYKITYYNSNKVDGVPVAIILQYGHGTRNGGWVEGLDYINPALKPVFDELADRAWKEAIW